MKVFSAPTHLLEESASATERESERYVYPHRLLYYADFEELPASVGSWDHDRFVLSSGCVNVRAANDLGRPRHRVVTFSDAVPDSLAEALAYEVVRELDWEAESPCEQVGIHARRHLFGFEVKPSETESAALIDALAPVFRPYATPGEGIFRVSHLSHGTVLEFVANTPVGNREWGRDLFIAVQDYSTSRLPILSYQGVRWASYIP